MRTPKLLFFISFGIYSIPWLATTAARRAQYGNRAGIRNTLFTQFDNDNNHNIIIVYVVPTTGKLSSSGNQWVPARRYIELKKMVETDTLVTMQSLPASLLPASAMRAPLPSAVCSAMNVWVHHNRQFLCEPCTHTNVSWYTQKQSHLYVWVCG